MQKIAIFGGTFNPVHNGHIHLANEFSKIIGAKKILLIPTYVPPHKQVPELASAADRLAMCRLAAQTALFEVSDIEIRRGGSSYTSDTLRELKRIYPNSELYLIMGEDMFLTLEEWHEPQVIYSLATMCAAPRGKSGCEALLRYAEKLRRKGANAVISDIDYLPVSSTMIRSAIKSGGSISKYVPKPVADYIYEKHLYAE